MGAATVYQVANLKLLSAVDEVPPLTDCQEIYNLGFSAEGVYKVDITGARDRTIAVDAYCKNGWTVFLRRGQYNNPTVTLLTAETL